MKIMLLETGSNLGPILSFFGSLIIAGVSVGIFICDGRRAKKQKRDDEQQELRDLYDYFKRVVNGIMETTKRQKQSIDNASEEIKHNPFGSVKLELLINKDFDRLSKRMDLLKIYKAYLFLNRDSSNDSVTKENFQKLIRSIDLIKEVTNQAKDTHIEYSNRLNDNLKSFEKLLEDEIIPEAGLLARKVRQESSNHDEIQAAERIDSAIIWSTQLSREKQTAQSLKDKTVIPIRNEIIGHFQEVEGGTMLLDKCRKFNFLFNEIELDAQGVANQLVENSRKLEEQTSLVESMSL
jgi:hypothetical protein